jgi:uncharacterized protein (TIGR03067 family)
MRRAILLLLAAGLLGAAPKDDAGKKDLARMQGDWAGEKYVTNGYQVEDDEAQALFRTVKGNAYTVFRFSKALGKGTFTLDAGKTPRAIDLTPAGGKTKPILGIYKIEGDTLTICYAQPGKPRPAKFAAEEGSGHTLTVWTREKK